MILPQFLVHLKLVSHLVSFPVVFLMLPGDQVLRPDGGKPVIVFTTVLLQLKTIRMNNYQVTNDQEEEQTVKL